MTAATLGGLRDALQATLYLLEVGVDELRLDHLDICERVDLAFRMDDVRVLVDADDVEDRVGPPDVGEELVSETLAAMRACNEAGDVLERDGVRDDFRAADRARDRVESLIGERHHGNVGLDRRERVVGHVDARACQRLEQRRLPCIGEPDDPDSHHRGQSSAMNVPSTAPASASLG